MTEESTQSTPPANQAQGSEAAPQESTTQADATAPSAAYRKAELKEAGKSLAKAVRDPIVDLYDAGRHFVHAVNPEASTWQKIGRYAKGAAKFVLAPLAVAGGIGASYYATYHAGTQNGPRREVRGVFSVGAGHLDDDAHADVVISYADGKIEPRYGDGTGKFYSLPPSGSEPLDLEVRLNRIRAQVIDRQ